MTQDDPPAPRYGLFVDPALGSLLDPQLIPVLLTTPPYHPAAPAPHHPCAKPYLPPDLPPVPARAGEAASAGRRPVLARLLGGLLRARRGRAT